MEKHRSKGVVSGSALIGDVAGGTAIVVDDLISSGTTLARASEACRGPQELMPPLRTDYSAARPARFSPRLRWIRCSRSIR